MRARVIPTARPHVFCDPGKAHARRSRRPRARYSGRGRGGSAAVQWILSGRVRIIHSMVSHTIYRHFPSKEGAGRGAGRAMCSAPRSVLTTAQLRCLPGTARELAPYVLGSCRWRATRAPPLGRSIFAERDRDSGTGTRFFGRRARTPRRDRRQLGGLKITTDRDSAKRPRRSEQHRPGLFDWVETRSQDYVLGKAVSPARPNL